MKSWIYFAHYNAGGPIKIGRAFDPHKRVNDLAVGSPIVLILIGAVLSLRAVEEEDEILTRLRPYCIRGEWFPAEIGQQEMHRLRSRFVYPEEIERQETPNDSLKTTLNIRVTAEELAAWKIAARSAGKSVSQWARDEFNSAAVEAAGAASEETS